MSLQSDACLSSSCLGVLSVQQVLQPLERTSPCKLVFQNQVVDLLSRRGEEIKIIKASYVIFSVNVLIFKASTVEHSDEMQSRVGACVWSLQTCTSEGQHQHQEETLELEPTRCKHAK